MAGYILYTPYMLYKKSCSYLCFEPLYKNGQDILDIQCKIEKGKEREREREREREKEGERKKHTVKKEAKNTETFDMMKNGKEIKTYL